ncbi:probable rhamnogalacturonate lyase C [Agrilus planipennis]|uniref:Probable rhamnogalacturonate lyase C n=1 Tax=Agrilus planipennis TaxID=224129 RepID=A0A1W4XQJ0_AGRPL|nr:probable rhamnogalacturonate lyase C [Agrilus planipennis]
MYSAIADQNGQFTIPAVRPGTYKLQVIAKGVVGKYIQNNINVQANENTDTGTINWRQESHGKLLWQIGVPDRTSAEFKSPAGFPSPVPNLEGTPLFK